MILTILVLILSILLAGFFKLIKLPNKLSSLVKYPFYPSSVGHPGAPPPEENPSKPSVITYRGNMKQVFDTFDKDGDGYITRNELQQSLSNIGMEVPPKEVEELMSSLDSNNDGLIDKDEFCQLFELVEGRNGTTQSDENRDDGDLKEAFDVFDGDRDGLITVKELGLVLSSLGLKEGKREEDCKEMIRKVDVDGDGMVNFDEFKKMMRGGASTLVLAF